MMVMTMMMIDDYDDDDLIMMMTMMMINDYDDDD